VRRTCEASIDIDASAAAVWDVVADVTRVGEWSGECRGCAWMGGAGDRHPLPGQEPSGWTPVVTNQRVRGGDEPHVLVWRTLPRFPYPDSVEWRLALAGTGGSTRVTESLTVLRLPKVMELALSLAMPAHRDRTQDLADDLVRLKRVVESPSP
jgi:hypothetical protein